MRIYKYPLQLMDRQTLSMPDGAKILSIQAQRDQVCLWAMVDENAQEIARTIAIYGTGQPIPDEPGTYMQTFQMAGGNLVFHAFEITD